LILTNGVVTRALALRGAALAALEERAKEVLLAGPAGTGKSFGALVKVHLMSLMNGKCLPDCQQAHEHWTFGQKSLLVRKTHVSLTATGLATFRDHVIAEALAAGIVVWYGGSGEKPPGYIYSNGSTVSVGGMDNPTKIMSSEYDLIYVQEATEFTPDDWEKCTTRLRNGRVSFQQLLADCNPEGPDHWLKKRCDEDKTLMLYSRHTDNPRLFDDAGTATEKGTAYLDTLSRLSGVRRHRLYGGVWAAAEGVIFENWDPNVHFTTRKRLPYDWTRIWGIDFGYTNPFVWQQWAIDPDGRLILEKEIYRSQRIVADHAQQILDVVVNKAGRVKTREGKIDPDNSTWTYPRPLKIICDHDAEDRATLERELGMGTTPAQKTVSDGLQAMMQRLEVQPDGLPRLQVMRTALVDRDEALAERGLPLGFVGEIPGYIWETSADGKPSKDRPLKLNDHSMDTGRYICADQDLKPTPRVRWL
jgi:PBSX family phage terminase large subunit